MTTLDSERAVLSEMQIRGEAALTRDQLERVVRLGSSEIFDATIMSLVEKGLVVVTKAGATVPAVVTLTLAGRSARFDASAAASAFLEPPPPDSLATMRRQWSRA